MAYPRQPQKTALQLDCGRQIMEKSTRFNPDGLKPSEPDVLITSHDDDEVFLA